MEIIEDLPDIDTIIVPLGAGSDAAAAITTLRAFRPEVEIIAVQAESSPAACNSWKEKRICSAQNKTFADRFATGKAYTIPFQIYKSGLNHFILLSEEEIYESIAMACYSTHNLAEVAAVSPIMAAFKLKKDTSNPRIGLNLPFFLPYIETTLPV